MKVERQSSSGARRAAVHALLQGGERLAGRPVVEWRISGSCTDPKLVTIEGKPWRDYYPGSNGEPGFSPDTIEPRRYMWKVAQPQSWVDMYVRCRRCSECLKARSHHWAERAIVETSQASRTWFGTLTLSPAEQWAAEARARARHADTWSDPLPRRWNEEESDFANRVNGVYFTRMHQALGPLLTRWLKRIRKESGANLRYLLVAEAHKSGRPHYHILIHESFEGGSVLHKTLSNQWKHGFSQFKLADKSAARYVCKYLAKSAAARIRASGNYGRLATNTPSESGLAPRRGRSPRL